MRIEDYVGRRIEELCIKYKISKYRLSIMTGISQSTLSYLIKKQTIPTLLTVEKICDAFNISLAQFFTIDKTLNDLSSEQEELLEIWNQLDTKEKRIMKTCIQSLKE